MSQRSPRQRIFVGIAIMIIGVLALVDNLRIFDIHHLFQFWPTVFVAAGILKLTQSRKRSSVFVGTGLITAGVVMTLNRLGIISFSWHDWWPVIIIAVGISIILKDKRRSEDCKNQSFIYGDVSSSEQSSLDITAIMGGNKTTNNTQDFKGGEITAIMGGVDLDLRGASIQNEAILNVWATWGGIALKIPQDWIVVNHGVAILGGIEDKSIPTAGATKRLIITGTAIMGGVEIKN